MNLESAQSGSSRREWIDLDLLAGQTQGETGTEEQGVTGQVGKLEGIAGNCLLVSGF